MKELNLEYEKKKKKKREFLSLFLASAFSWAWKNLERWLEGLKKKDMGFAVKTACNENGLFFSILVGFWS